MSPIQNINMLALTKAVINPCNLQCNIQNLTKDHIRHRMNSIVQQSFVFVTYYLSWTSVRALFAQRNRGEVFVYLTVTFLIADLIVYV